MPTYYARANGNVNAAIWATTPTGTASDLFSTFTNADTLVANGFSVVINVNVTVAELRGDTTGGATAGGQFTVASGVTVTATVNNAGNATNGFVLTSAAAGTFTFIGNILGNGTGRCFRVVGSNATVNITGAVTANTNDVVVADCNNTTFNIVGNVTGGNSGATCIGITSISGGNIFNVTGNVTGGPTTNGAGVSVGANTVNITGTVAGGSAGIGVVSASSGTTTVVGTVVGAVAAGASVSSTGTLTATRARGGPLASSAVGIANGTGGSIVNISEIEYGDLGASPTSGPIRLTDATSNVAVMYRFGTTKKNLVDANASGLMPAASNVRSGTVYNGGNSTGTCAVPAAGSVALGVPVDNTTGTAALTPAAVWSFATSSATTSGSMGERLANAATVASTGQQLANALTP
jgi:hypothetical protein